MMRVKTFTDSWLQATLHPPLHTHTHAQFRSLVFWAPEPGGVFRNHGEERTLSYSQGMRTNLENDGEGDT